jgi:hypothetical protein
MKITKILLVVSSLFAFTSANAGTLEVTGSMETTWQKQTGTVNGNPLGTDRELKFAGSTELDNGITVSVMQDTGDTLAFGNSQLSFGNIMGLATIYVGSDHDPIDAIDDITPSAYEEANGSGSGTYGDLGINAGSMGIGTKVSIAGISFDGKYYPKTDGVKTADNATSGTVTANDGSGKSATIAVDAGAISGGQLDGLTLTVGVSEHNFTAANGAPAEEGTVALNYAIGAVKLGYQKKIHTDGSQTAVSSLFYKDDVIGLAYAVNDNLSVSINRYTSMRHSDALSAVSDLAQETDAINIGYTVGGMTIGLQSATTENLAYATGDDDSTTLGVSVAF